MALEAQPVEPLPFDYGSASTLPTTSYGAGQYQLSSQQPSAFQRAWNWLMGQMSSNKGLLKTAALNPEMALLMGAGRLAWPALQWLGQHSVPTDPYQTWQNSSWMRNPNITDPFGQLGAAGDTEGDFGFDLESRFGDMADSRPPGQMGGYGGYGGGIGGPGGMSSYMIPVAGGGPGIPVIQGPQYTGAPYNPHAFEQYIASGGQDQSWWDQYQNEPWQHWNGSGVDPYGGGSGSQYPPLPGIVPGGGQLGFGGGGLDRLGMAGRLGANNFGAGIPNEETVGGTGASGTGYYFL